MDLNLYLPIDAGRHDNVENEAFDKSLHSSNHRFLQNRDTAAIEIENNLTRSGDLTR